LIQITLVKLAEIVAGELISAPGVDVSTVEICGAEFDSRRVKKRQLFIALGGAATHGHKFLGQIKNLCSAALVEDAQVLRDNGISGVVVKNSLIAMQTLSAWWRQTVALPVLAITGSVGKTTTKEIAAAILSTLGRGTSSEASFNNHVGVPYTLLQIARDDAWAVIEIGMNHRFEIAPLSKLAAPNVALVTTIAPAHIGNLGSLRAIAEEKLDIAAGLQKNGTLLLNSDSELLCDPLLTRELGSKLAAIPAKLSYFGTITPTAKPDMLDLKIESVSPTAEGIAVNLTVCAADSRSKEKLALQAPLFGIHHATNIAAALAGALRLCPKLNLTAAAQAVALFQVPEKRFVRLKVLSNGAEIFDDSYNANPASMRAFFAATQPFYAGKKWGVVLGEMRELGDFEAQYHREIAQFVIDLRPNFVIAVGVQGALVYEETFAPQKAVKFVRAADSTLAINALSEISNDIPDFEVLVVKGARGVELEKFVKGIT